MGSMMSSQWRSLAPLPEERVCAGHGLADDGTIIVTGGYVGEPGQFSNTVLSYDRKRNQWKTDLPQMGTGHAGHRCVVCDMKVFVLGGSVEMLDLNKASKSWKTLSPMAQERSGFGAERVGKKIYVFGGQDRNRNVFDSMECFDLETETWESDGGNLPSMPSPRCWFGSAVVGNTIYVVGGMNDKQYKSVSSVMSFDTSSKTWKTLPSMEAKRRDCAVAVVDHFVVAMGGSDHSLALLTIEVYDSKRRAWSSGRIELPKRTNEATFAAVLSKEDGGHEIVVPNQKWRDWKPRERIFAVGATVDAVDFENDLLPIAFQPNNNKIHLNNFFPEKLFGCTNQRWFFGT